MTIGLAQTGSGAEGGAVFYRFRDATGRVHIVDSLDLVPSAAQASAERIRYGERTPDELPPVLRPLGSWRTAALGFAAVVLLWFVARRLPRTAQVVFKVALVALAVALVSGAYFGWLRETTGHASAGLASPKQLMDDAQAAVDKMNARLRVQQAELRAAEQAK